MEFLLLSHENDVDAEGCAAGCVLQLVRGDTNAQVQHSSLVVVQCCIQMAILSR